jgi:hypothetical protein
MNYTHKFADGTTKGHKTNRHIKAAWLVSFIRSDNGQPDDVFGTSVSVERATETARGWYDCFKNPTFIEVIELEEAEA